ncbi:helix-turn-helix domain-containing protein [Nocardioides donggukensis]|uniref:Helix-turn-helix domain-containing protein n=1 Tax=Nocardioides donggukensis TaxID=2774019 RepID=A0A927KA68_9ACTN|nr:helix-turn-helix domain-containing protein [Nocardioides donggukensis]MBD8870596.1 helix-turn-helix domain-containing protein [Nocardioides donggukensis]
MDTRQAELLSAIDPAELGRRLRAARIAQGLTQADLSGPGMSVGYVSRMESGQRRPTAKVLTELAGRLGAPLEQFLGGVAPREVDEIRLTLDYAELSLESGEPVEAEAKVRDALERIQPGSLEDLAERGRFLLARCFEAQGLTDDAILAYEALVNGGATGLVHLKAGIGLSRTYRESGDLTRAIDNGEKILANLADTGLDSSDESVQLAVSVASAHFERGDSGHAVRICRTAIAKAEALGSATARASAYWNASAMQAERGDVRAAVPLAEMALNLLSEGRDARNLSRLRAQLGRMQLALDPPELEHARGNLEQATQDLAWSSASPAEFASIELELARAHYLAGDLRASRDLLMQVQAAVAGDAPLLAADAKALEGQLCACAGDTAGATAAFLQATRVLTGVGADRGAAQLWFDLAGLLDEYGLAEEARDAYRRAAASAGLRARTSTPSRTLV